MSNESNESDQTTPFTPPAADAPPPPPPPAAAYGGDPSFGSPPPPPEGYGGAALPPPPAPPGVAPSSPSKTSFLGRRLVRIVITIVVVVAIGAVYGSLRNKHDTASAPDKGSCIWAEGTNSNNPKIHKVDCTDPKAQYTVLSKVSGGDQSACDTVTGTDASYTETANNKPVYVLCLQQTK